MRKYSGFIVAGLLIVGVVVLLSGCTFLEKATEVLYTAAEKAELTAKAITGYGWESGTTNRDIFAKDVSFDLNVMKEDFSGSDFYNNIANLDNLDPSSSFKYYFGIQFAEEGISVTDSEGGTVTVTLNGTVYFAYFYRYIVDENTNSITVYFDLFAYSPDLTSSVVGENPDNYTVDIHFYVEVSYSEIGTTTSGSIVGNVGDHEVDTSFSVTTPQVQYQL